MLTQIDPVKTMLTLAVAPEIRLRVRLSRAIQRAEAESTQSGCLVQNLEQLQWTPYSSFKKSGESSPRRSKPSSYQIYKQ